MVDDFGGSIGKISVYLYPIIQNITSIPVFCIIIRYNLENSGMSKRISHFISVIVPWILAIPLFTGSGFTNLCDFTGIVLASFVNFILPPYLYLLSIQMVHHHICVNGMMAVSGQDSDESDSRSPGHVAVDAVGGNDPTNQSRSPEHVRADDSESEHVELIEMSHIENEAGAGCPVDINVEDSDAIKKNKLRCTWDVTQAVICMVVAGILSTVVIIEKVYVYFV